MVKPGGVTPGGVRPMLSDYEIAAPLVAGGDAAAGADGGGTAGADALPCTAESMTYLLGRLAAVPDGELDRLLAGTVDPGLPGAGFGGTAAAFRTHARQLRASAAAFDAAATRLLAALRRAGM